MVPIFWTGLFLRLRLSRLVPRSDIDIQITTSVNRTEFYTPGANCFKANDNTAFSEQVFNISVTEIETIINPNRIADDVARNTIGATQLAGVFKDPDFDPAESAVYYVRVLEIPTPRWTLYDKVRFGIKKLDQDVPLVHQERAFSSPIWYGPEG